jgi:hypothetical protein
MKKGERRNKRARPTEKLDEQKEEDEVYFPISFNQQEGKPCRHLLTQV